MYDFGPLAAQYDEDLLHYFHVTKQVSGLILKKNIPANFIFVARPGAGKTALMKWLTEEAQERRMLFIRPTEVRLVIEDSNPNAEDHRILMSAELFAGLISEAKEWKETPDNLRKECSSYIRETWWESLGDIFSERFEGLSILGNGFSLRAKDRQAYLSRIRKDNKVEKSSSLIRRLAKVLDVTLVVDNPEFIVGKGLEDVTTENAMRIGAFLSVLNGLHSLGVQVVIFVKEHILQSVQDNYRDFSHFEDRVEGLEWTEDDLLEMLNLRIDKRLQVKWEDIFTLGKDIFVRYVFAFLVNGPRDLLFICNTAGRNGGKISKPKLERSIEAMRKRKWVDIATQYGPQWPNIDAFARRITQLISEKFDKKPILPEEFRSAIEDEFSTPGTPLHELRKQEKWMNTAIWASPSIEERLFVIGCLGYILGNTMYFPWAGRSLERFRLAKKIFVSPLFL
jgi:hypothetical protein